MWDIPFGKKPPLAGWDCAWEDEAIIEVCQQVSVVNERVNFKLGLYCPVEQVGDACRVLIGMAYTDTQVHYIYKPEQNTAGVGIHINAVECLVIATKGARRSCTMNFRSPNPQDRHNLHFTSVTRKKCRYLDGEIVNPTQKPVVTAHDFAKLFVPPGGNLLVLCAGSGSEVIGGLLRGCNVTAVELDKRQCDFIETRSRRLLLDPCEELLDLKRDLDHMARIRLFCNHSEELAGADFVNHRIGGVELSQKERKEVRAVVEKAMVRKDVLPVDCVVCGIVFEEKKEDMKVCWCPWCAAALHVGCKTTCGECSVGFCTEECQDAHPCIVAARQEAKKAKKARKRAAKEMAEEADEEEAEE